MSLVSKIANNTGPYVTDRDIVAGFRFERVLDTLAQRSGVPSLTGEQLFRQWFDTRNRAPGLER